MEQEFTFQCNICFLNYSQNVVPMIICRNSHFACRACIHKIRMYQQNYYKCPFCKVQTDSFFPFQFKKIFAIKKISNSFEKTIKDLQAEVQKFKDQLKSAIQEIFTRQYEINSLQDTLKDKEEQHLNQINRLQLQNKNTSRDLGQSMERNDVIFRRNLELENINDQLKQEIAKICKKYEEKCLQSLTTQNSLELECFKKLEKQKLKNGQLIKQNQELYAQILRLKARIRNVNKIQSHNESIAEIESIKSPQIQQAPSTSKSIKQKKIRFKKAKQIKLQVFKSTHNLFNQMNPKNDLP